MLLNVFLLTEAHLFGLSLQPMFLRLVILQTLYEIAHLEAVPCFGDQLANATPKLKGAQAPAKALWNENHFNLISSLKSGGPLKLLVA